MRKIVGMLLVAFAIVACNTMPKDAVILSGKVENAKQMKELKIVNGNGFSKVIKLKEDGSFLDTIKLKKAGNYMIAMGRGGFRLYLMPEDNLKIALDLKDKENPLKFVEGKAVVVNQFVQKTEKKANEKLEKVGGARALFSMNEDDFLKFINESAKDKEEALNAEKDLPKDFVELVKKTQQYGHFVELSNYKKYHGMLIKDKEYKASEKITKPLEGMVYNNAKDYEEVPMYKQVVLGHFQEKLYEDDADEDAIIEEVKATGITALKKDFAEVLVESLGLGEKDLAKKEAQIKSLTDDKEVIKSLNDFLATAEKLGEGKPSPKFAYKDINGKEVKLEDLKGKLVYIDVWATWCGPCKGELPHLKKLEKAFHWKKVHFVSISVDENEAAWKKMVKEKKLGGIQLHADKAWSSDFVKAYKINGIPRFILLDKKGNIITADAPRPSSDKIKPLLKEWLKKR